MRLRTLESFNLLKNGLLYSYPSLQKDIDTEVVVIGGGITGALISHALVEKGYEVLLLDKRDIAQGSTAATTSLLQYEIDVPLTKLSGIIGEEDAAYCYKAGIEAVKNIESIVENNRIDCGFKTKNSLYISHNKKARKDLIEEYKIRNKHNLGVEWLDEKELEQTYGLCSYGGIVSNCAASVDAYKLAHELIQLNVKRGMLIYDQTEVIKFELNDKPVLYIMNNFKIKCKKVIFCTGFEATEMLKEKIAKLFYTYVCISETEIKLNKNIKNSLIWNTDDPYLYLRYTEDNRLLVGGEDSLYKNSFNHQKLKEKKSDRLVKKVENLLPGIKFIPDFNWGGVFGSTKDGLPYVGQSPEYANALFVLGFGGNGITFSVQAMDIITSILEGKNHMLAKYYRFGR